MAVGILYRDSAANGTQNQVWLMKDDDPTAIMEFEDKLAAKTFLRANHIDNFKGLMFAEIPTVQE